MSYPTVCSKTQSHPDILLATHLRGALGLESLGLQIPNTDSGWLSPKWRLILRIRGDPGYLEAWRKGWQNGPEPRVLVGRDWAVGSLAQASLLDWATLLVLTPEQAVWPPATHNPGFLLLNDPILGDSMGLAKPNSTPFSAPLTGVGWEKKDSMDAVSSRAAGPPAPQSWHPLIQLCGSSISLNTQCCFL